MKAILCHSGAVSKVWIQGEIDRHCAGIRVLQRIYTLDIPLRKFLANVLNRKYQSIYQSLLA